MASTNELNNKNNDFSIAMNDSKILKVDEVKLIKEWFENKNFSSEILYSSILHEKSPQEFHEKCDGITNTLVLIQTDSNRRFGGFTKLAWSRKEGWVEGDGSDFIFSLCKQTKFLNNQRKDCAIYITIQIAFRALEVAAI